MKKSKEDKEDKNDVLHSVIDRQSVLDLFKGIADDNAEAIHQAKLRRERETIELLGGSQTSLFEEQKKRAKLIESIPQNYGTKFSAFFEELARLADWTEEEKKAFHKPHIAPNLINRCIYSRFPETVTQHLSEMNPYVRWCVRKYKHYMFLGEDAILMLEKFIDEAVIVMKKSTTVYEFEKTYSSEYGKGFQPVLFEEYLGLVSGSSIE